jgi:hypothetical protein
MREAPTVTLRKDGPRYAELHTLWGDEPIPVTGYRSVPNWSPDGVENFFQLDWKRVSTEMRGKLVDHLVKKWKLTAAQVEAEMAGTHGLPIRERDVNPPAIPLAMFI